MAEAPALADRLATRPALLDAVLTAEFSAPLPDRRGLAADLASLVAGARDFEDTLDLLRRWADERRFQVGVQLLRGGGPGGPAGGALADIAETALATLLPAVTADFVRLHGEMPGGAFAIVAMGRLGSREMSLASDLDLILIYDAPQESAGSTGPRPLALTSYYARLTQRLISAIAAPTAEGRLYPVDMRSRPSGKSGPIASSLAAFAQYQREIGVVLGTYGADPGAADRRRCRPVQAHRGGDRGGLDRAARPAPPRRRRRSDAPPHRRERAAPLALGSAQPARRADRSRIHGAISDAARSGAGAAGAAPRRRHSTRRTWLRRRLAAAGGARG